MTFTLNCNFELETCFKCGVQFGVPAYFKTKRLEDHESFFCPNGHGQHYTGESEAERYKREAVALRAKLDQERMASEKAMRERDAALRAKERLRKRAKAGVCAFCNRTFSQLAKHMECKHPGVKP